MITENARLGNLEIQRFQLEGFQKRVKLDSMKTTIDIPENALADVMRFTGAKTKRAAVVQVIEDFNRRRRVESILAVAGTFPDLPTNDELEAADIEHEGRLVQRWERGK